MGVEEGLANKWTIQLEGMRASIEHWRSGKLRITEDGKDVTATYVDQLEAVAEALEEAIESSLQRT